MPSSVKVHEWPELKRMVRTCDCGYYLWIKYYTKGHIFCAEIYHQRRGTTTFRDGVMFREKHDNAAVADQILAVMMEATDGKACGWTINNEWEVF